MMTTCDIEGPAWEKAVELTTNGTSDSLPYASMTHAWAAASAARMTTFLQLLDAAFPGIDSMHALLASDTFDSRCAMSNGIDAYLIASTCTNTDHLSLLFILLSIYIYIYLFFQKDG